MMELIGPIYAAIQALRQAAEAVQANKLACARLAQRFSALLDPLAALERDEQQQQEKMDKCQEALRQLLALVKEATTFVRRFQAQSYFIKAWKRNSDHQSFAEYNVRVSQAIADLQLGLQVDGEAQRREDMEDARKDLKAVMALVERALDEKSDLSEEAREEMRQEIARAHEEQLQRIDTVVTDAILSADIFMRTHARETEKVQRMLQSIRRGVGRHESQPDVQRKSYQPRDLQYSTDDEFKIGSGAYGIVYKGEYQGHDVAVKVIKMVNVDSKVREDIQEEVQIHQMLDSPAIIRFHGATMTETTCVIVMELAVGSLYDFLYVPSFPLRKSLYTKLRLFSDIMSGVQFLHSCMVIHRDLKPRNCLICYEGNEFRAKLSDFGLSKVKSESVSSLTVMLVGTPAYMAPEQLTGPYRCTQKSDIYSAAILGNELITEQAPFQGLDFVQIISAVVVENVRPEVFEVREGDGVMNELRKMLELSWDGNDELRPAAKGIVRILRRLSRAICERGEEHMLHAITIGNTPPSIPPLDAHTPSDSGLPSTMGIPSPVEPSEIHTRLRDRLQAEWSSTNENEDLDLIERLQQIDKELTERSLEKNRLQGLYVAAKRAQDVPTLRALKLQIQQVQESLHQAEQDAERSLSNPFSMPPEGVVLDASLTSNIESVLKEENTESKLQQEQQEPQTEQGIDAAADLNEPLTPPVPPPSEIEEYKDSASSSVRMTSTSVSIRSGSVTEKDVLMQIFFDTNGCGWSKSTKWGTDAPLDDWFGVECENGHVMKLELRRNNLRGGIPSCIGDLRHLQVLNLEGAVNPLNRARLSGEIPTSIGNLKCLRQLFLSRNHLQGRIPDSIGQLGMLRELYLAENKLTGQVPNTISQLSYLVYLNLGNNRLSIPSSEKTRIRDALPQYCFVEF